MRQNYGVFEQNIRAVVELVRRLRERKWMPLLRPFTDHPRSLGMSWAKHGVGAVAIGVRMIGAGAACVVHAIVPALFSETAGKTVVKLHEHMTARRAGRPDWPDYEI